MVPFSLYLHVPFCAVKCGYCSFYSRPFGEVPASVWLNGVSCETRHLSITWGENIPLRTIYIGGGTPSALPVSIWKDLLDILKNAFDFSSLEEFTVEANPCSLTNKHLLCWRDSRVTRVSLGIQSLNDNELEWLGRVHNAKTALRSIEKTLSCGFDVSADLMFGLTPQTLASWRNSLRSTIAAGLKHISIYQLTLEPGVPLAYASESLPDGYPFYRFAQWYLNRKGLPQYEIASFAPPDKECRHNLTYWRQGNVLAIGPSAWGYIDGQRFRNARTLEEYSALVEKGLPIVEAERLKGQAQGIEAAILALRTRHGLGLLSFAAQFGEDLAEKISDMLKGMPPHLLSFKNENVSLTPAGMRVGNAIWSELLLLDD